MTHKIILSVLLIALNGPVLAYGGAGGGDSSCTEPSFSAFKPPVDVSVPELPSFSFEVSANTQLETLDLQLNGEKLSPNLNPLRTGDTLVEMHLKEPIKTAGKARITVRAKSREGCENFQAFYLTISP